ncbi:MAG: Arm DNA-binding domain-containing protein, partial [Alphaproteobacteria bacterium]|nr:Arm DNA-binding domain-containing protein [Alphaproteobacteria bacterium]
MGAPTELALIYSMAKLTKRKLDSTTPRPGQDVRLWDDDPRGFGVRIKPSGVKTFFVQYRSLVTDKKVRYSIGQYGRLSLDEARTKAKKLLGSVADDHDPSLEKRQAKQEARSTARAIGELCEDYMRDAHAGIVLYRGRPKKPTTLAIDEGRIRRHINPLLGHRLVKEVTSTDITVFMHDVRTGKTA